MSYNSESFFGGITLTLVRHGEEVNETLNHNGIIEVFDRLTVYKEMMYQISMDYPGLPNVFELKASQIRFFYEGVIPTLKEHTKPKDT